MKDVTFHLPDGWTLSVRGIDPDTDSMRVVLERGDELILRASHVRTDEARAMKSLQDSMERCGGMVSTCSPSGGTAGFKEPEQAVVERAREAISAHRERENSRPVAMRANRKAEAS